MASPFASRRRARKIGAEEDTDADSSELSSGDRNDETEKLSVPKKQLGGAHGSTKPKRKSGLRLSFGPGEGEAEDDSDGQTEVFTPKKSTLSRKAMEKNAVRKSLAHSLSSERLPIRPGSTDGRPSYSKDHLEELKTSTPSTPKDIKSLSTDEDEEDKLGVLSKFGTRGDTPDTSAIPTEAEIREKKQRRARLAKEQEYIDLSDKSESDEDSEDQEISLLDRKKWGEGRLVREDEDLGEGFDEFVDDGSISLGKKAEREQSDRRRREMQEMIEDAEGSSGSDDSDDSEAERRAEYEATQTRAGTYGSSADAQRQSSRPKTPPKISPLPNLQSTLQRLQESLAKAEHAKTQKVKKMEDLVREKTEIETREVEIQRLLKEAGDNYERLRIEAGLGENGSSEPSALGRQIVPSEQVFSNRGLESFGSTPIRAPDGD
ncbi:MAG: hypothetical protein M4579_001895 [Chaenotheca gracillima]|nr:MAG: hypothetical protein M4579_001895 [Chaenotheca gracillima]